MGLRVFPGGSGSSLVPPNQGPEAGHSFSLGKGFGLFLQLLLFARTAWRQAGSLVLSVCGASGRDVKGGSSYRALAVLGAKR